MRNAMNEKRELYNLVAENIKRDMVEIISRIERFTELVSAGITTSSDQEIHATARHLRGAAERLNFELNKR